MAKIKFEQTTIYSDTRKQVDIEIEKRETVISRIMKTTDITENLPIFDDAKKVSLEIVKQTSLF